MPLANRQDKFKTPISTRFSPFSSLFRTLQPTQVQNQVSLGLPPKQNTRMSASSNLTAKFRGSQTKPTEGGLLGNIAGYITGKGISKGTGKGVKPVEEIAGLSDTAGVLGSIAEDAPTLGIELAGVARPLRA